jgi:hypothetical protein
MRYLLISPIYLIADLSHTSPNKIFSLLVVMMCMTISISLANTITLFQKVKNHWEFRFFLFLFFAILSLTMNGRLIFGLCAYAMMIYGILLFVKENESEDKKSILSLFVISLSILFSSVSSGVAISLFTICFSSILGILLCFYWKGTKINSLVIAYMLALFLMNAPIISCLINKNVSYFGDGFGAFIFMTLHGTLGGPSMLFKAVCLGFMCLMTCYIYLHRTDLINYPMRLFIAYCMGALILLSSFAYSILIMAVIPAVIMLILISGKTSGIIRKHFFEGHQVAILLLKSKQS